MIGLLARARVVSLWLRSAVRATRACGQLDLGAEIVHGNDTVLFDLLKKMNEPLQRLFIWAQGDGGPMDHKGALKSSTVASYLGSFRFVR